MKEPLSPFYMQDKIHIRDFDQIGMSLDSYQAYRDMKEEKMKPEELDAAIAEMKAAGVRFSPAEIGGVTVHGVPGVESLWAMSETAAWPLAWGYFTFQKQLAATKS